MRCPYCGHQDSKVTDSREVDSGIRRRRQCRNCGVRFTTYERIQSTALMVSKRDNRREEFNREKLVTGIRKACAKRPVASRTIEKMVEDIENALQHLGQGEVPSDIIGEMVMDRLKNLDRVAYIRYASVYRDFQDIESFERAVKDLREDTTQLSLPQMGPGSTRRQRRYGRGPRTQYRARTPKPDGHADQTKQNGVLEGDFLNE
jgi:transcriptional repressor NrdR